MSRDDWFRSTSWSPQIEEQFYVKLRRATKQKRPQYLCLQAYHLCQSHPEITLRLLDEYFALGDRSHAARAYTFRAEAHLRRGDVDRAVEAYEAALAHEKEFPNTRTQTRIELPFLIASHRVQAKYDLALTLLGEPGYLLFPVERFKYRASLALISADRGEPDEISRSHAVTALREAAASSSGLRHHMQVGLVGKNEEPVLRRLSRIVGKGV